MLHQGMANWLNLHTEQQSIINNFLDKTDDFTEYLNNPQSAIETVRRRKNYFSCARQFVLSLLNLRGKYSATGRPNLRHHLRNIVKICIGKRIDERADSDQILEISTTYANLERLDTISLPYFSGDLTEWISFRDFFEYLVVKNDNLSDTLKIHQFTVI